MSLRIKVTTQQYSIRCVFNKSGGVSKKWWSEPYSRPPHLMHWFSVSLVFWHVCIFRYFCILFYLYFVPVVFCCLFILLRLYFGKLYIVLVMFVFWNFAFCSICISIHFYFNPFVFRSICISIHLCFNPFVFRSICILAICILWCMYFVFLAFPHVCILFCLYFGVVFCPVCIMEHLYFDWLLLHFFSYRV